MKPEIFFTDSRGRVHATPENAARDDIAELLNVPAGVAERIIDRFDAIAQIVSDMRDARASHGTSIRTRDPKVIEIAPRRKTAIPAACRANQGE